MSDRESVSNWVSQTTQYNSLFSDPFRPDDLPAAAPDSNPQPHTGRSKASLPHRNPQPVLSRPSQIGRSRTYTTDITQPPPPRQRRSQSSSTSQPSSLNLSLRNLEIPRESSSRSRSNSSNNRVRSSPRSQPSSLGLSLQNLGSQDIRSREHNHRYRRDERAQDTVQPNPAYSNSGITARRPGQQSRPSRQTANHPGQPVVVNAPPSRRAEEPRYSQPSQPTNIVSTYRRSPSPEPVVIVQSPTSRKPPPEPFVVESPPQFSRTKERRGPSPQPPSFVVVDPHSRWEEERSPAPVIIADPSSYRTNEQRRRPHSPIVIQPQPVWDAYEQQQPTMITQPPPMWDEPQQPMIITSPPPGWEDDYQSRAKHPTPVQPIIIGPPPQWPEEQQPSYYIPDEDYTSTYPGGPPIQYTAIPGPGRRVEEKSPSYPPKKSQPLLRRLFPPFRSRGS